MRVSNQLLACVASALCLNVVSCSQPDATSEDRSEDSKAAVPFSSAVPYSADASISFTASACNLETINQQPFGADLVHVRKASPLTIAGWGYDDPGKQPAKSLHVVLMSAEGKPRYFAHVGPAVSRPDVGQFLHLSSLVDVGFDATLSLSAVEPGTYRAALGIVRTADVAVCDVGRRISISG